MRTFTVGVLLVALFWSKVGQAQSFSRGGGEPTLADSDEVRLSLAGGMAFTHIIDTLRTPLDENLWRRPVLMGLLVDYYGSPGWGMGFWTGYEFDLHRWQFLIGPRLAFALSAFQVSLGMNGGWAVFGPGFFQWESARAELAPDVNAELNLGRHLILGIRYVLDVPLYHDLTLTHRVMLTEGVRF